MYTIMTLGYVTNKFKIEKYIYSMSTGERVEDVILTL